MPSRMKMPCKKPGCPNLRQPPALYCDLHAGQEKADRADYDRARGWEGHNYSGTRWKTIRQIKVAMDPLCEACLRETPPRVTVLDEVHHVIERKRLMELGLSQAEADAFEWLESLCRAHHNAESAHRRAGKYNEPERLLNRLLAERKPMAEIVPQVQAFIESMRPQKAR